MKDLDKFISEASINAKKRNVDFAKKLYINGKMIGNIKNFGIVTAENPSSQTLTGAENKALMKSLKDDLKKGKYIYVPVEGHFSNNTEHSVIIFNIKLDAMKEYAGRYDQTSFFWCYPNGDKVTSEYWQKKDNNVHAHRRDNPYEFVNKTDEIHMGEDEDGNYTLIGKGFKYTVDSSVFSKVDECIEANLTAVCEEYGLTDRMQVLDDATNGTGPRNAVLRAKIYKM